jgi:hypothetical protein
MIVYFEAVAKETVFDVFDPTNIKQINMNEFTDFVLAGNYSNVFGVFYKKEDLITKYAFDTDMYQGSHFFDDVVYLVLSMLRENKIAKLYGET